MVQQSVIRLQEHCSFYEQQNMYVGEKGKAPSFSLRQHYLYAFVAYNKTQVDINRNYREAVRTIKEVILHGQYRAATSANKEQLSPCYGTGHYVSKSSRMGFQDKRAIERISSLLQEELPGLRGFSTSNIKDMQVFYEEWGPVLNHQPLAGDLVLDEKLLLSVIRQPLTDEFNWSDFFLTGFSHRIEIIPETKALEARLFYIHECVIRYWSKYTLRDYSKADLYGHRGTLPSNFAQTLPDTEQALKAVCSFRNEYLPGFTNVEEPDEQEGNLDEKIVEKPTVTNVKKFTMTFGQDFSFIGNQYHVEVAGEGMFIDLLFFNWGLNSLVAVELKSRRFRNPYLGQLNTYLSALGSCMRKPREDLSIGVILCREMNQTFVELAVYNYNKPMGVATYHVFKDMPGRPRNALPDIEELRKLLWSEGLSPFWQVISFCCLCTRNPPLSDPLRFFITCYQ